MAFWRLLQWCSPLPFPNREVKPTRANDTAIPSGKVSRRQPLFLKPLRYGGAFFYRSGTTSSFEDVFPLFTLVYWQISELVKSFL